MPLAIREEDGVLEAYTPGDSEMFSCHRRQDTKKKGMMYGL
jgi:hypothetical protein